MSAGFAVGDTMPPRRFGPVDAAWVRRYTDAALDPNPLHRDPGAARAAGFAGPILPGMLLLGLCEHALRAWTDRHVAHLSGRFLLPLVAPVDIEISGRVVAASAERVVVRLFVRACLGACLRAAGAAGQPACIAEAWLRPAGAG